MVEHNASIRAVHASQPHRHEKHLCWLNINLCNLCTHLDTSLVPRKSSNLAAQGYSNVPNWWHFRISSIQHRLFDPTVHKVTGCPTTISHSRARVIAVLNNCRGKYGESQQLINIKIKTALQQDSTLVNNEEGCVEFDWLHYLYIYF